MLGAGVSNPNGGTRVSRHRGANVDHGNPTRPHLTEDEIKEAIGDAAKAREIFAVLHGKSSEKIG